eukprot:356238-Chlamydomonas_euryale.AAC.3
MRHMVIPKARVTPLPAGCLLVASLTKPSSCCSSQQSEGLRAGQNSGRRTRHGTASAAPSAVTRPSVAASNSARRRDGPIEEPSSRQEARRHRVCGDATRWGGSPAVMALVGAFMGRVTMRRQHASMPAWACPRVNQPTASRALQQRLPARDAPACLRTRSADNRDRRRAAYVHGPGNAGCTRRDAARSQ